MNKPAPAPLDPAKVRDLALAVIAADRFPVLATVDGEQPRVRPVSPVRTDKFTVYVANLRMYHKTAEIAANPMGVPVSDVVPLVRRAANRTMVTTPNRAVVVVRRPVRTFSPRLAEAMRR